MPNKSDVTNKAALVKSEMANARRDLTGFSTDDQPHVTEQQFEFLSWRVGTATDEEACTYAEIDPDLLLDWLMDPNFVAVYETCLANKREGLKLLSVHLNGKVLRVINRMLSSSSEKSQKEAANMLIRIQGLYVDKTQGVDRDAITRLMEEIMRPKPATVLDIK